MCEFCKIVDFGVYSPRVENGYASIYTAGGSSRFGKSEQFNFCPVCGKSLAELEARALTITELRERMKVPIWVKKLSPCVDLCDSGWAVISDIVHGLCWLWWFGSEVEDNPSVHDYGKAWVAFDREPKEEQEC